MQSKIRRVTGVCVCSFQVEGDFFSVRFVALTGHRHLLVEATQPVGAPS